MSSVQFVCVASCFVIGTVPVLPSSFPCSSIPPLGVHHLHVRVAFTHSAVPTSPTRSPIAHPVVHPFCRSPEEVRRLPPGA